MGVIAIIQGIENSGVSEWLRTSLLALPIVNAIHVMALATVFGTIFIVDLRLLGYPNTSRPFTLIAKELLRWTWAAFAVAAVTGVIMFTANATTYMANAAFLLKMLLLALAGVNMAVFQFSTMHGVAAWDTGVRPPARARAAGALSMAFWTAIILLGRVIGFTKSRDFGVPEDIELEFSALEGALASAAHLSQIAPLG